MLNAGLAVNAAKLADPLATYPIPGLMYTDEKISYLSKVYNYSISKFTLEELNLRLKDPGSVISYNKVYPQNPASLSSPKVEAKTLKQNCNQIKKAINIKVKSPAMKDNLLGIITYCNSPEMVLLDWIKDRESQLELIENLNKVSIKKTPPTSCKQFEFVNPGGCNGCIFKDEIDTPLQTVVDKAKTLTKEDGSILILPPFYYLSKDDKIVKFKQGAFELISDIILYIDKISIEADGDNPKSFLEIKIKHPTGVWLNLRLNASALYSNNVMPVALKFSTLGADLRPELRNKTINYLIDSKIHFSRQNLYTIDKIYEQMGWHKNNFIWGKAEFQPNQPIRKITLSPNAEKIATQFHTKGDINTWKSTIAVLNRGGCEYAAFIYLLAYANLLIGFLEKGANFINLYSPEEPYAKSVILNMMLSVYGDPTEQMYCTQQNRTSILEETALKKNLPTCVEDVSKYSIIQLTSFLNTFNSSKNSLPDAWSAFIITISNYSFYDKIMELNKAASYVKEQILEIKFDISPLILTVLSDINAIVCNNYGHAAPLYIQHILKRHIPNENAPTELETLITASKLDFEKDFNFKFQPKERYWQAALSSVYLAAKFASEIDLVPFDYRKIIIYILKNVIMPNREYLSVDTIPNIENTLSHFINIKYNNLIRTSIYNAKIIDCFIPELDMAGRLDMTFANENLDNLIFANISIMQEEFEQYCKLYRKDYQSLLVAMRKNNSFEEGKRTLTTGLLRNPNGLPIVPVYKNIFKLVVPVETLLNLKH